MSQVKGNQPDWKAMKTTVSARYTPSLNVSVTTKGTEVTRVTLWETGVPGSTQVVHETPRVRPVRVKPDPLASVANRRDARVARRNVQRVPRRRRARRLIAK